MTRSILVKDINLSKTRKESVKFFKELFNTIGGDQIRKNLYKVPNVNKKLSTSGFSNSSITNLNNIELSEEPIEKEIFYYLEIKFDFNCIHISKKSDKIKSCNLFIINT